MMLTYVIIWVLSPIFINTTKYIESRFILRRNRESVSLCGLVMNKCIYREKIFFGSIMGNIIENKKDTVELNYSTLEKKGLTNTKEDCLISLKDKKLTITILNHTKNHINREFRIIHGGNFMVYSKMISRIRKKSLSTIFLMVFLIFQIALSFILIYNNIDRPQIQVNSESTGPIDQIPIFLEC